VDVLIDRRELLAKARERNLNLNIVEKDYVLGWLLFGFSLINSLVFKGGTALSKIYFPKIWRLSEDLDFTLLDDKFSIISERVQEIFNLIEKKSGIKLNLKSEFSNPDYLQLKIQYHGVIGKNWVKIDITKNDLIEKPALKSVKKEYSDYKDFKIKVESVEEIFCSKLRTVIERKKCRDYFDLWKLTKLSLDLDKAKKILKEKLEIKGIKFTSTKQIFPNDLHETLLPYWERELGRLVYPLPDLELVLEELRNFVNFNLSSFVN
jgi:predicted nucleotidyltransferase component of viral defense system